MKQLMLSNTLYGREREIEALLDSFDRISSGQGEVLLVPGSSGVGKTALVQELKTPIRDRNAFFVRGKFEQYQQNVPYFAFRQALTGLYRQLQSADARQSARFKVDILRAVGTLGQVLVDLAPEFGAFLGAQPPLTEISPQEARHRFADVCRRVFQAICLPEHPLVLFIDDWQWADVASCDLLRQMQVGKTLRYLLLIASYRDDEVSADHPLLSALDDLRSHAVPVTVVPVGNLTAKDVQGVLTDALRPAISDVAGLATLIQDKTLGNPFFVRSFLSFIHELNLIWYDEAQNLWQWRMERFDEAELPGEVVELFVLKLRLLDPDTRKLLSLAACLGNRFDLDTLGTISGHSPEACEAQLCSGPAETMLQWPKDDESSPPAPGPRAPKVIRFLHDRVQQAAYSLIAPADLPAILLDIGRLLLASLPPEKLTERLFEVVGDLNAGRRLPQETPERVTVLELNLAAARKAYAATAYRSALQFYLAANSVLETPGLDAYLWRERHELAMQLCLGRAECEFLEGTPAAAEESIQQAVAHADTVIEKATALTILIVQYTLLARYPEAIAAGRLALDALGISLPETAYEEARDRGIALVRQEMEGRSITSLSELPVMSHPEMLMASKILITMGPPCYRAHQLLWSVLVPKVVNLTLRYGNIPQVGYSHTAFGGLLGWVDDDYAAAKEFGELATQLMTHTFDSPPDQSVYHLMIGSSIRHWHEHLRAGSQDYANAYEIGLRSNNLQYAAYAFGHNMYCRFYQGAPLSELIQETLRSLEFSRTRRNQWAIDLLEGGLSIFQALSGESAAPDGSDAGSDSGTDEAYLRRVAAHHNIQVTCIFKILKTFSLLISGDHEAALAMSDAVEPLLYTVGTQGLLPWPEHVVARLLARTSGYAKDDTKRQEGWRSELDLMLGRLRIWADSCPENFEHKYQLAAAEVARIDGRLMDAGPLYDKAVEAARSGGFLQWESLAHERAYSFWMACGKERLAQMYWQQAYMGYERWGALAKVRAMESTFRTTLAECLPVRNGQRRPSETPNRVLPHALVEGQIAQLRRYAVQLKQSELPHEAESQAADLGQAMQRVRVEIASRKRTEEALRESERALKESQRIAGLGSYVLELSTGSWQSSEVLDEVFGIGPTYDRSVEGWAALIHPDDRAMMVGYLTDDVAGRGEAFDKDYRILRHDNQEERWVHGLGKLERDAQGRPLRLIGTIQDITERNQLIRDLREAAANVKSLSGLLPICASCKRIRDDKGYWSQVESYISKHSEATFSHGMCPECVKTWYPDV